MNGHLCQADDCVTREIQSRDRGHPGGLDKRAIAERLGVTRQAIEQSLERSKELLRTRYFGLLEKML